MFNGQWVFSRVKLKISQTKLIVYDFTAIFECSLRCCRIKREMGSNKESLCDAVHYHVGYTKIKKLMVMNIIEIQFCLIELWTQERLWIFFLHHCSCLRTWSILPRVPGGCWRAASCYMPEGAPSLPFPLKKLRFSHILMVLNLTNL